MTATKKVWPTEADAKPYVYTYNFQNSKENPVEPRPDYEGAVVYRYDEVSHQYFPIGSINNGCLVDTIPAKLGEWCDFNAITGDCDCGNENGSYRFDSCRDRVPVGVIEIGRPKFDLSPEELIKFGTAITKFGWDATEIQHGVDGKNTIRHGREIEPGETIAWGAIEACQTPTDVAESKEEPKYVQYSNFTQLIREGNITLDADDQRQATGGRGGAAGKIKRQTVVKGSKKKARRKTKAN